MKRRRVSVSSEGVQADKESRTTSISADGKYIAFYSWASNLVSNDTNTCPDIFVHKMDVPVTDVTLNKKSLSLNKGNSESLIAIVSPDDATYKNVIWSSNNITIADVDTFGKVTAVGGGAAVITVTTIDRSLTSDCQVSVNVPVTGIGSRNKPTIQLYKGTFEILVATVFPDDATDRNVIWSSSNTDVAYCGYKWQSNSFS